MNTEHDQRVHKEWKTIYLSSFLLVVAVFGAFWPALAGEFLHWDDHSLFLENLNYRGIGWPQWQWMCTTTLLGHWQPLTWLSYAFDYQLWGLVPQRWHITNLLLHSVNAILVYLLCLKFLPLRKGLFLASFSAALLYAIHPLRVEAVAWLATRGYLLGTTFCLLTVLFYVKSVGKKKYPLTALFCFALACMTKGIGMMLPIVLLFMDYWFFHRIRSWRTAIGCVVEKTPFWALSLFTGMMAFLAKKTDGGMASIEQYGWGQRIGQAAYGVWFYLTKTLFPVGLSPLYYKKPSVGMAVAALICSLVLVGILVLFRRQLRFINAAAISFLVLLFPMLGFTQSGIQTVADRFTYLSSIPLFILLGAGILRVMTWTSMRRMIPPAVILLAVCIAVNTAAWSAVWTNSWALWSQAARSDPDSAKAYNGMGQDFLARKEYEQAAAYFAKAIELDASCVEAYQNRALCRMAQGQNELAIEDVTIALSLHRLHPIDQAKMLIGRGQAWEALGVLDKAEADYTAVLDLQGISLDWKMRAMQVRARLYLLVGKTTAGVEDLNAVLALPDPSGEFHRKSENVLCELNGQ